MSELITQRRKRMPALNRVDVVGAMGPFTIKTIQNYQGPQNYQPEGAVEPQNEMELILKIYKLYYNEKEGTYIEAKPLEILCIFNAKHLRFLNNRNQDDVIMITNASLTVRGSEGKARTMVYVGMNSKVQLLYSGVKREDHSANSTNGNDNNNVTNDDEVTY